MVVRKGSILILCSLLIAHVENIHTARREILLNPLLFSKTIFDSVSFEVGRNYLSIFNFT